MHTPGQTMADAAEKLLTLRRIARMERKAFGAVSTGTQAKIAAAIAAAEAVCIVDDARENGFSAETFGVKT
jgi:hypothetical protein